MSLVPASGALVTIRAFGETKIDPEIATANLSVVTEAVTPSEALDLSAARMAKVMDALRGSGIAQEDMRTTGLYLTAQYTQKQGEAPVLRGYQVRNSIIVTVRELAGLGSVLKTGVEAGANQLGGVSFKASNMQDAQSGARRAAVESMMTKSEEYARLVGRTVKALKSLEEKPEGGRYDFMDAPRAVGGMADGLSGGQLSVRVDVEGVFELD